MCAYTHCHTHNCLAHCHTHKNGTTCPAAPRAARPPTTSCPAAPRAARPPTTSCRAAPRAARPPSCRARFQGVRRGPRTNIHTKPGMLRVPPAPRAACRTIPPVLLRVPLVPPPLLLRVPYVRARAVRPRAVRPPARAACRTSPHAVRGPPPGEVSVCTETHCHTHKTSPGRPLDCSVGSLRRLLLLPNIKKIPGNGQNQLGVCFAFAHLGGRMSNSSEECPRWRGENVVVVRSDQ